MATHEEEGRPEFQEAGNKSYNSDAKQREALESRHREILGWLLYTIVVKVEVGRGHQKRQLHKEKRDVALNCANDIVVFILQSL